MSTFTHYFKRAVLVASGAAVLSVGAGVSAAIAEPVSPNETPASAEQCQMYQGWYSDEVDTAVSAVLDGNARAANDALVQADYTRSLASRRGCDVSAFIVKSQPPVRALPVGPARLSLRRAP